MSRKFTIGIFSYVPSRGDLFRVTGVEKEKQGSIFNSVVLEDITMMENKSMEKAEVDTESGQKPLGDESTREIEQAIQNVLYLLQTHKPNDRSNEDRRWAIVITEMEKVQAYFCYHIAD